MMARHKFVKFTLYEQKGGRHELGQVLYTSIREIYAWHHFAHVWVLLHVGNHRTYYIRFVGNIRIHYEMYFAMHMLCSLPYGPIMCLLYNATIHLL